MVSALITHYNTPTRAFESYHCQTLCSISSTIEGCSINFCEEWVGNSAYRYHFFN